MTTDIDTKDPKFLAFWTKCLRETSHWSQEALAAASGLDVRTIQRIEAGHPISVTTRRALARGLGYDNPDVFEDPDFIKGVQALFEGLRKIQDEDVQKQFPDHIRVNISQVKSGDGLARIAYEASSYLFHADDTLSDEAKETAAGIFDFLRDLGDIADDISFADRLGYRKRCPAPTFRHVVNHEIRHGLRLAREFLHGRSNGASHKWREAASQSALAR